MKLSIFIGSLIGGGAERVACNLANYLSENGHDVNIIVMSETKETYPLNEKIEITPLLTLSESRNPISRFLLRVKRLKHILRAQNVDAYIVMLPITIVLFLLYSKFTKAKIIITERNSPHSYTKMLQFLLRKLVCRADLCICQTETIKEWYDAIPNGCQTKIIPNAINPNFIKPIYIGDRRSVIVTAGRLNKQKNQALLIRAFAKVSELFDDYDLEIYGTGALEVSLKDLVSALNIAHRVHFKGYVEDVGAQIRDASIFVLSSDFEGMPNALMEAMALGLPCISTDCDGGGAKFLIQNNINGLLVQKNNEEELANAIITLLEDTEKANRLGTEAYKIVETLSPKRIYGMWYENISNLVNHKQSNI